jgi:hypothetical protein
MTRVPTIPQSVLFGALAGIAVLVPLIFTWAFGPQWWQLLIALVLLVAVVLLRFYLLVQREGEAAIPVDGQEAWTPSATSMTVQQTIVETTLPSSTEHYRFKFYAKLHWESARTEGEDQELEELARITVTTCAADIAQQLAPGAADDVQRRIAEALTIPVADTAGRVRVRATEVAVRVPPEDAEQVRKLTLLGQAAHAQAVKREEERELRRYLRDDVLHSTGSAVVWWFTHNMNDLDKAVERADQLSQLSALAQDRNGAVATLSPRVATNGSANHTPPIDGPESIRQLLDRLFPDETDRDTRMMFADSLARLADEYGLDRYSAHVRSIAGILDPNDVLPQSDQATPPAGRGLPRGNVADEPDPPQSE